MIYLLEAIWYGFLIFFKIAFWPAIVLLGFALFFQLIGLIIRGFKAMKKKNAEVEKEK